MPLAAEKELEHIGETKACANHDHDLVHELSKRLDSIWRYDQYIANAAGMDKLENFWQQRKEEDLAVAEELKQIIGEHIEKNCF